jgi:hypothetical protein
MGSAFRLPCGLMPIMSKLSSGVTGEIFKLSALTHQQGLVHGFSWKTSAIALILEPESTGLTDNEIAAARMAVSIQ